MTTNPNRLTAGMMAFCQIMRRMNGTTTVNTNCSSLASQNHLRLLMPSRGCVGSGRQTKNITLLAAAEKKPVGKRYRKM